MKDTEIISNLTKIRVKLFTHNDLDGVSCALMLKKLYNLKHFIFDFEFIDYKNINKIKDFFNIDNPKGARYFDYLFITDLNFVSESFYENIYNPFREFNSKINNPKIIIQSIFKKIFIIDHHKDTEDTLRNKVETFFPKIEYYNDMINCASKQLFNFIKNNQSFEWSNCTIGLDSKDYLDELEWCENYINHVNDWDTFNWKNNSNFVARDLNLLFTHIPRNKFFLMQEQKKGLTFGFNKTELETIKNVLDKIQTDYKISLSNSLVLDHIDEDGFVHNDCNYIIIQNDDNVSIICDMLKEDILNKKIYTMFNICYIVNVSYKYNSINFRRVYDNIDLSKIANIYGGGGHSYAAGCVLDTTNKLQLERILLPIKK